MNESTTPAPTPATKASHLDACAAVLRCIAEEFTSEAIEHARRDDPHALATIGKSFDDGKARRELVLVWLGDDAVRVILRLVGTQDGKPVHAELCGLTVRDPAEGVGARH